MNKQAFLAGFSSELEKVAREEGKKRSKPGVHPGAAAVGGGIGGAWFGDWWRRQEIKSWPRTFPWSTKQYGLLRKGWKLPASMALVGAAVMGVEAHLFNKLLGRKPMPIFSAKRKKK